MRPLLFSERAILVGRKAPECVPAAYSENPVWEKSLRLVKDAPTFMMQMLGMRIKKLWPASNAGSEEVRVHLFALPK